MEKFTSDAAVIEYPDVKHIDPFTMQLDVRRFLNPYLLAEQISLESYDALTVPKDNRQLAWHTIERGLRGRNASTVYSSRHFLEAEIEEARPRDKATADMILANVGLLALRANSVSPSATDIVNSYRSVALITDKLLAGDYGGIPESDQKGLLGEAVTYALLTRPGHRGYVPYFGSRREEASPLKEDNHDVYTIGASRTKVAIQVKYRFNSFNSRLKRRSTFAHRLFLEDHILHNVRPDDDDAPVKSIAKLIAQESQCPHSPASKEDFMLAKLSLDTMGVVSNHQARIQDTPAYRQFPYRPHVRTKRKRK
jgi:hypothetical protein